MTLLLADFFTITMTVLMVILLVLLAVTFVLLVYVTLRFLWTL